MMAASDSATSYRGQVMGSNEIFLSIEKKIIHLNFDEFI